jgi:hypothetical protein
MVADGVTLAGRAHREFSLGPAMTDPPLPPPSSGGARIVDATLFQLLVEAEIHKAQRLRYCISVICISVKEAVAELSAPMLELFRRQLRATDVVAAWPPGSLALLLIDAESGDIPSVMGRITASLAEGSWSAGGVSYPRANRIATDMVRHAVTLMERALRDPAKHLYLG